MNSVIDAVTMKETASRGQVAIVYGVIGLVIGAFLFQSKV